MDTEPTARELAKLAHQVPGLYGDVDDHGDCVVVSARERRFTGRRIIRTLAELEELVALPETLKPRS
jgi:hypothetical protein